MLRIKCLFVALLAALAAVANIYKVEDVPNVHVANRTRFVSNPDGILSPQAQAHADSILSNIWANSSAEVVAVVVDDIDSDDIDLFATKLFEHWGIGKKDKSNGLLVLVAKDRRKAVMRTGYGLEGVLPDVVLSRMLREEMFPEFKRGDYDQGVLNTLNTISYALSSEEALEEVRSQYGNDQEEDAGEVLWNLYLMAAAIAVAALLAYLLIILYTTRHLTRYERYKKLDSMWLVTVVFTFLFLGAPLVVLIPLYIIKRRIRTKPHICSNCGDKMVRLDEATDNQYLTPVQDYEEKINSVDYDVWLCPNCNVTEIYPFVNKLKAYTECPACGARACALTEEKITLQPTTTRDGKGEKTYTCMHCHKQTRKHFTIAKLASAAAGAAAFGAGMGRGGGGGFSGGSFGGGFTGGGGASGGW